MLPDFAIAGAGGVIALALKVIVDAAVRIHGVRRKSEFDERGLLSIDEREFRQTLISQVAQLRVELTACEARHAEGVLERLRLEQRFDRMQAAAVARGVVLENEVTP
jgi:predicted component of type VI protein secretion system